MKKTRFFNAMLLINTLTAQNDKSEQFWTQTYQMATDGHWGKTESVSGPGSTLDQTTIVRREISNIIKKYNISTILDLPCGDFNWMQYVDLQNCIYIGADIVAPLIEKNNILYKNSRCRFLHIDATKDSLPSCDLIICRDLLVHLSSNDVFKVLKNFKNSGAKYLLTTFFTNRQGRNSEIESGGWRPINLQKPPFNFPKPEVIINEQCTEQNGSYNDKSLGLWLLQNILIIEE